MNGNTKMIDDLLDIETASQVVADTLRRIDSDPMSWPLLSEPSSMMQELKSPCDEPSKLGSLSSVIFEARNYLLSGMCNVSRPDYFGYISPKPHPASVLGDYLVSSLNQTPGAWRAGPAATVIEAQVLHWFRNLFSLAPAESSWPGGVFTGGGTIANVMALKLARDEYFGKEIRDSGLMTSGLRVYTSEEGHFSLDKAMDILGFGKDNLVRVPCDNYGAIDSQVLEELVMRDYELGLVPICIVATLGTTATGAVDSISECSEISKKFKMWFHIDGASGLAMTALPEVRRAIPSIEHADSITFDPCKWMFASFGVGCLLVRDGSKLVKSFGSGGHYWEELDDLDTFKMNVYGTRQCRSVGIWTMLSYEGFDGYRTLLRNILNASRSLRELLEEDSRYELLEQHGLMPVVCFRVKDLKVSSTKLVQACHVLDIGYPTEMVWKGESYLRVSISNYSITANDVLRFKSAMDSVIDKEEIPENA